MLLGMPSHANEPHQAEVANRLNWLRAGVLGANDGLVSTAGLVIGVAAADSSQSAIMTAGIAGLVAGAVSMALGEYVSVSTQRDTERALIAKESAELAADPADELAELIGLYRAKGLTEATARQVAAELTEHDALEAHLDAELHLDSEQLSSPIGAAISSAVAFSAGALVPILAALVSWNRIAVIVLAVAFGLAATGYISASIGSANRAVAMRRVFFGGLLGMGVTFLVGLLLGTTGIA